MFESFSRSADDGSIGKRNLNFTSLVIICRINDTHTFTKVSVEKPFFFSRS